MSNARDDLPEPLTPVNTVKVPFGISRLRFFKRDKDDLLNHFQPMLDNFLGSWKNPRWNILRALVQPSQLIRKL